MPPSVLELSPVTSPLFVEDSFLGLFGIGDLLRGGEAVDLSVDYLFDIARVGEFTFRTDITRNLKNDIQVTPSSDVQSRLGFIEFIKTRATTSLEWRRAAWTARWATQYYSGYDIDADGFGGAGRILSQGSDSIASQVYHDLLISYDFDDNGRSTNSILENTTVEFAVVNIFDKAPPFDATQINTAGVSVYGDPRLSWMRLSIKKSL